MPYTTESLNLNGQVEFLSTCTSRDGNDAGPPPGADVQNPTVAFQYTLWVPPTNDTNNHNSNTTAATLVEQLDLELHQATAQRFLRCQYNRSLHEDGFYVQALSSANQDALNGPCPSSDDQQDDGGEGDGAPSCYTATARMRLALVELDGSSRRRQRRVLAEADNAVDGTVIRVLGDFFTELLMSPPWDHPGLVRLRFDGFTNHPGTGSGTDQSPPTSDGNDGTGDGNVAGATSQATSSNSNRHVLPWIAIAVAVAVLVTALILAVRHQRRHDRRKDRSLANAEGRRSRSSVALNRTAALFDDDVSSYNSSGGGPDEVYVLSDLRELNESLQSELGFEVDAVEHLEPQFTARSSSATAAAARGDGSPGLAWRRNLRRGSPGRRQGDEPRLRLEQLVPPERPPERRVRSSYHDGVEDTVQL